MVNELSISFLNLKISFFVVLFYFFSFLRFPLFSRWLFDCLYLKPFQWVHVKVLAELEILDLMRYVTMLLWILILLFHLHLWVYFVLLSIRYYVTMFCLPVRLLFEAKKCPNGPHKGCHRCCVFAAINFTFGY